MAISFGRRRQLTSSARLNPPHLDAVADALQLDGDVRAVCAELGRALAGDGSSLEESLDALEQTFRLTVAQPASFEALRALATSWTEASLQYLNAMSCEDPLTGLAGPAHLRSRLAEIHAAAGNSGTHVGATHALVVVELVDTPTPLIGHRIEQPLRLAAVAECLRSVYAGGETVARLGACRAAALVPRAAGLGDSVAVLRRLLADWGASATDAQMFTRVWIERLPSDLDAAGRLLDELSR